MDSKEVKSMDTNEIGNKVKGWFEKGSKATKEALEKAGDKVQDFTDKSVVKIEKHQLESKRDLKYEEMGLKLSQMLLEGAKVTSNNEEDVKTKGEQQLEKMQKTQETKAEYAERKQQVNEHINEIKKAMQMKIF